MYIDTFTIAGIVATVVVSGLLVWACRRRKARRCLDGRSPCG